MGVYTKIVGTVSNLFQLGRRGPQLKNNSGVVEHRNAGDSAFVIARGADPVGNDDFVTKRFGDTNYTGGGGGSAHVGQAVVDFGAFPGKDSATVTITGQTAILAGSTVEAWLFPKATSDHSADEHLIEQIDVRANAASIVAGTGFDITALTRNHLLTGQWNVAWYWT